MALSRLARLALNAASEFPPADRADAYRIASCALRDDCPDLAELAATAAANFHQATESEAELLQHLNL